MTSDPASSPFDDFMDASRITSLNASQFAFGAADWVEEAPTLSVFDQAAAEVSLPPVDDKLQELFASRKSSRRFTSDPVPTAALAEVLSAAGCGPDGRPVVPSAGGLDPLGIYAVVHRGEEPFDRRLLYYQHREHRVAVIGDAPDEATCRQLFGLDCDGMPPLLLAFAVDPGPTSAKYGERGGRFLLQQVGHAMQNVSLRLSDTQRRRRGTKLHGYILGGVTDDIAELFGFAHTRARLIAGYAIGTGRPDQAPG